MTPFLGFMGLLILFLFFSQLYGLQHLLICFILTVLLVDVFFTNKRRRKMSSLLIKLLRSIK